MKLSKISTENPLLTAYALGELESTDAEQVAAAISHDPAAQQLVLEIRNLAEELKSSLKDEPILSPGNAAASPASRGTVVSFPYYLVSAAAAAGFVLLFALRAPVSHQAVAAAPQPASVLPTQSIAPVVPAALRAAAPNEVAGTIHHLDVLPDGFSDLKPAPFRDGGYRLGKSIADNTETKSEIRSSIAAAKRGSSDFSPSLNYGIEKMAPRLPALVYSSSSYAYEPARGYSNVNGFPFMLMSPNVNTASHGDVQRYLQSGHLPPPEAVRIEELLNYFAYSQATAHGDASLAASLEVASAPWNPAHRLVRIGVKGAPGTNRDESGMTIAKDMKIQVEFNPEQAQSYRLIGYEEHASAAKSSAMDPAKVAGSELESGHEVTALYEVVPVAVPEVPTIDGNPLRYVADAKSTDPRHRELLTLKIRYTLPIIDVNRKMEIPLVDTGTSFAVASKDFKLSAAVAGFGMMLKESPGKTATTYDDVLSWASDSEKDDKSGKRNEFIDLVKKAKDATVE